MNVENSQLLLWTWNDERFSSSTTSFILPMFRLDVLRVNEAKLMGASIYSYIQACWRWLLHRPFLYSLLATGVAHRRWCGAVKSNYSRRLDATTTMFNMQCQDEGLIPASLRIKYQAKTSKATGYQSEPAQHFCGSCPWKVVGTTWGDWPPQNQAWGNVGLGWWECHHAVVEKTNAQWKQRHVRKLRVASEQKLEEAWLPPWSTG